ncbi:unnamed protein product [Meloidogyne enterolobii]|uniref:Uncharacterized protein n=1 Tax=Meloidogyne enterolobii TaxID=390850 RepID=A0ACB0XLW3_MELEN
MAIEPLIAGRIDDVLNVEESTTLWFAIHVCQKSKCWNLCGRAMIIVQSRLECLKLKNC